MAGNAGASRRRILAFASIAAVSLLSGCGAIPLSDDRIREETAGALGLSDDQITISNVRHEWPNAYYVVTTKGGQKYACTITTGDVVMGVTAPPHCNPQAR